MKVPVLPFSLSSERVRQAAQVLKVCTDTHVNEASTRTNWCVQVRCIGFSVTKIVDAQIRLDAFVKSVVSLDVMHI
jgi:hypothetical protein